MIDQEEAQKFAGPISAAQAGYIRSIDDGNLNAWPDYFIDNCFYQVTTSENIAQGLPAGMIWLDNKSMLRDRVNSLREANIFERHAYRHFLGQPYFKSADGNEVECETTFMVARITRDGPTDLFATGRYLDRWRVDGPDAKIVSRIVVLDSNLIDTLLGLPL